MDKNTSEEISFGELLKQLRKRRNLTQKQLAKKIEASPDSVSFWEREHYKPETDGVLYYIVEKLNLTPQEQQQLFEAYTVTALATSFHNPPFKRNPYFTGRSVQLKHLHKLLMAGKQVALTQAISGLGGIGKTQLALEYAYRHQKSYHDIFWVNADTEESWMDSYVQLAGLLHLPEYEEADQNKVKDGFIRWLRKHSNWLIILDNVEDLYLLQQFIPDDGHGAVLLTTRREVTEPVAQALELELLPENDAILFLLKRTKTLAVELSLEAASEQDIEATRAITQLLGNLPLALDQAGAYILETPCSFAQYLTFFQTYRGQLLQRRIGENMPTDHPAPVTATFTLNFQQVQQRNPAAGELLRLCAFLAPDVIPEEILTAGASSLGVVLAPVAADAFQLNRAIEALRSYSLIRRNPTEKTLSIHRLIQAVLQDMVEETERRTLAERAMLAVNAAFPEVKHKTWVQCERLLANALLVTQSVELTEEVGKDAGRLLQEMATYLNDRTRYTEAEALYQRSLIIWTQQVGQNHLQTAYLLHDMANFYREQGKYAEAEPLFQQVLSIREQQLGVDHYDTIGSLNNLAILYAMQGKDEEAENLFLRVLLIREKQLGQEHAEVAVSLNNLAIQYQQHGRLTEAEPLYERALHIWEKQLGAEHPNTLSALDNLSTLYAEQKKYEKAEILFQQVLHMREQQLGEKHPKVAISFHNLGDLYQDQKKYAEAQVFYRRCLDIIEEKLGTEHPNVLYPLTSWARSCVAQSKYAEAEALYQRALHIMKKQLGSDHPDTVNIMQELAEVREKQSNS